MSDDARCYKAVIYGVDHEHYSNEEIIAAIDHALSHFGLGHVRKFGYIDVEWGDEHPMNHKGQEQWFDAQDYKKVGELP